MVHPLQDEHMSLGSVLAQPLQKRRRSHSDDGPVGPDRLVELCYRQIRDGNVELRALEALPLGEIIDILDRLQKDYALASKQRE